MLLLHEFHARKFLLPDRLTQRERERLAKRDAEEAGEPVEPEEAAPGDAGRGLAPGKARRGVGGRAGGA